MLSITRLSLNGTKFKWGEQLASLIIVYGKKVHYLRIRKTCMSVEEAAMYLLSEGLLTSKRRENVVLFLQTEKRRRREE